MGSWHIEGGQADRCEEMTHPQEVRLIWQSQGHKLRLRYHDMRQPEGLRPARAPYRWGGTQKPGEQRGAIQDSRQVAGIQKNLSLRKGLQKSGWGPSV